MRSHAHPFSIKLGDYPMTDVEKWVWIVNKNEMACRNAENNVTVKMYYEDGVIKGKIQDMPMELFGEISEIKNGEKIIMQIIKTAEKEFLKE